MSCSAILTPSLLTASWVDVLASEDGDVLTRALFALYVQHAWGSDGRSSTPLVGEYSAHHLPVTQYAGFVEADEEELCDSGGTSTDTADTAFNTTEDVDQTLELLNTHSVPEWQTGIFVGIGLVSPICAALDISTRKVRRAGKSVLRKRSLKRKKRVFGAAYNDNGLYEQRPK